MRSFSPEQKYGGRKPSHSVYENHELLGRCFWICHQRSQLGIDGQRFAGETPGPEGTSKIPTPGWRDVEQGGIRWSGLLQDPRTAAAREFHMWSGTTPATAPRAPPRTSGGSGPGGPQGARQGGSTAPIVTAGSGGDGRAPRARQGRSSLTPRPSSRHTMRRRTRPNRRAPVGPGGSPHGGARPGPRRRGGRVRAASALMAAAAISPPRPHPARPPASPAPAARYASPRLQPGPLGRTGPSGGGGGAQSRPRGTRRNGSGWAGGGKARQIGDGGRSQWGRVRGPRGTGAAAATAATLPGSARTDNSPDPAPST